MDLAVARIRQEIREGRPIGVFGHFDCDGVTATALLCEALGRLGAVAVPHIPGRNDEYGIPLNGVERLAAAGARLIITVDCGIRAIREVEAASHQGIEIIITDHHQCQQDGAGDGAVDVLPPATAVINPRRQDCPYPFKALAGVGLSFRLAQAMSSNGGSSSLRDTDLDALLDLVCLGTIADIVDILGENRLLVARGLGCLREMRRPGLLCLAEAARLTPGSLTARDVAFALAPRINAAARLQHGKLSLQLLRADCLQDAAPLAAELERLNQHRRQITDTAVRLACQMLAGQSPEERVLVAAGHWISGISGLIASQLKDRFGRPALAISDLTAPEDARGDDPLVGSSRSISGFDITGALSAAGHRLVRFGGHSGAAGFTVLRRDLPGLKADLESVAQASLSDDEVGPRYEIDALMAPQDLGPALFDQLDRLEPCGQGNPPGIFLLSPVAAIPGSVRSYEEERYACRFLTSAGPVRASGHGEANAALLRSGSQASLVCQIHPDVRSPARLKLTILDARPATPVPLEIRA
jgi:single-stranded-DNA-specific exonuclease